MNLETFLTETFLPTRSRTLKPKTFAEYDRIVRVYITPTLGRVALTSLNAADVERLHNRLKDKPVQANRAHAVLSSALALAVAHGHLTSNPCAAVKLTRELPKERFLTDAESARLTEVLKADPGPEAVFLRLLMLTGARPGEIQGARREWLSGAALRLPDAKRGPRTVYLSPDAVALLLTRPERPDGLFFPKLKNLARIWKRLSAQAGLTGVRMYDLRHTFASTAMSAGADIGVIGKLLGHTKAQSTLRYAHLSTEKADEITAAVAARMSGK
jgi:integrase